MKMALASAVGTLPAVPPTPECVAAGAVFVNAVQERDWVAVARTLHPRVEMHCHHDPAPRHGEYEVVCALESCVASMDHFRAESLLGSCDHPVLRFSGTAARSAVDGVVLLDVDELGLVVRITVMMRPTA